MSAKLAGNGAQHYLAMRPSAIEQLLLDFALAACVQLDEEAPPDFPFVIYIPVPDLHGCSYDILGAGSEPAEAIEEARELLIAWRRNEAES